MHFTINRPNSSPDYNPNPVPNPNLDYNPYPVPNPMVCYASTMWSNLPNPNARVCIRQRDETDTKRTTHVICKWK